jgi:hypothetical protein
MSGQAIAAVYAVPERRRHTSSQGIRIAKDEAHATR